MGSPGSNIIDNMIKTDAIAMLSFYSSCHQPCLFGSNSDLSVLIRALR